MQREPIAEPHLAAAVELAKQRQDLRKDTAAVPAAEDSGLMGRFLLGAQAAALQMARLVPLDQSALLALVTAAGAAAVRITATAVLAALATSAAEAEEAAVLAEAVEITQLAQAARVAGAMSSSSRCKEK